MHALIFHTLGLNLREEVGVFCRLRVLLMAEGRGISLQLLDWYSRRRETTTQDGPGPNKRWPLRIKTAKGNGQRGPGMHSGASFSSWLVEGTQQSGPAHPTGRTWKI